MTMLTKMAAGFAACALFAVSAPAQAAVYDAVSGFGNAANSVWSYGSGSVGAGFVALPDYAAGGCAGWGGLACHNDNASSPYTFPMIGKSSTGADLTFAVTDVLKGDELFVQSLPGNLAILRFTAPTAGAYAFNGMFQRLDSMDGHGDGVTAGVYTTALDGDASQALANSRAGALSSYTFTYSRTLDLAAGQSVDFYLDAHNDTYFDGTGVRLTVAGVPEPATWALMIGGFGLAGAALRRRRMLAAA